MCLALPSREYNYIVFMAIHNSGSTKFDALDSALPLIWYSVCNKVTYVDWETGGGGALGCSMPGVCVEGLKRYPFQGHV